MCPSQVIPLEIVCSFCAIMRGFMFTLDLSINSPASGSPDMGSLGQVRTFEHVYFDWLRLTHHAKCCPVVSHATSQQ